MREKESVVITNMCMVTDGSRVLVQDRIDPEWSGLTFPGGHVEKGESFTDAVIREVFEETGLRISAPRLCGIKDWCNDDGSRYMVLLYRAEHFEGELHGSEEGEVRWLELEEMRKMPLADGMDKMLEVFLREDLSEHWFYKENGEWAEVLK